MKKIVRDIFLATCCTALAIGTTGCLEEAFPEDDQQTAEQIKHADKAALASAIPAYFNVYDSNYDYDAGLPAMNVWRDAMSADLPIYNTFSTGLTSSYISATTKCSIFSGADIIIFSRNVIPPSLSAVMIRKVKMPPIWVWLSPIGPGHIWN